LPAADVVGPAAWLCLLSRAPVGLASDYAENLPESRT
jgi:hypothetical protein